MYDKLDWLTVNQLIAYHTLIQVYKIRSSGEPEYLHNILKHDNRAGHIVIPVTDLTLAMKSFTFRGAKLWNSLPTHVRCCSKVGMFKKQCRKLVKEVIPRFLDQQHWECQLLRPRTATHSRQTSLLFLQLQTSILVFICKTWKKVDVQLIGIFIINQSINQSIKTTNHQPCNDS